MVRLTVVVRPGEIEMIKHVQEQTGVSCFSVPVNAGAAAAGVNELDRFQICFRPWS